MKFVVRRFSVALAILFVLVWTSQVNAGPTTGTIIKVDGSSVTQPVSLATTIPVNCTSGCAGSGGGSSAYYNPAPVPLPTNTATSAPPLIDKYQETYVAPGPYASAFPVIASTPFPSYYANPPSQSNTITANAQSIFFDLGGSSGAGFAITGTWTGTIGYRFSDDGVTVGTSASVSGSASTTSNVSSTIASGHRYVAFTSTAWTSGTATITVTPLSQSNAAFLMSAAGSPITTGGITDGMSAATNLGIVTDSFLLAYNGTNMDRIRKDTYAAGPLWFSAGGSATNASQTAGTAGPTVIKASAGRLARAVITTAGTSADVTIYDNASACSGTKLAVIPGTTSDSTAYVGKVYTLDLVAANGITACGASGSPAITVGYF